MTTRILSLAAALVFAASSALAQQAGEAPAATQKDTAAPECVRIQRHDHGADRGFPGAKPPCKPVKTASAKPRGKVDGHDHGRMHKNQ
jgi:hypothetical protein